MKFKTTRQQLGLTLIELITVIIILAILAVIALPKFINLQQDAYVSNVKGTGGSFASGISLAHIKWAAMGNSGPADNLQIYENAGINGQLYMNLWGYPAQSYPPFESSPRLNNTNDCISVWNTILQDSPSVSTSLNSTATEYRVTYINPDQCRFFYNKLNTLSIYYDSRNGQVITDSEPNS
ncbi:prepilin-type N-terminal cleavage/methylation domain-containing protein [Shewanella sp. OMA3-2]|uniref:prepilin-type N-terminal cleavage/methylation domain-containing protein n=1 Tax=Shewanella sp. OMA3-2 TaxID=2908650 RepID=UPI001F354469|nr:prepilin-type N-terminal cleavage/methylation domain-containing protein [Shewanella sp. OMA3-2]UJF22980.1 prepilin-type N-terminal cleavage/methylation domain-containing protein [Shewanella sp. OMA3-2]